MTGKTAHIVTAQAVMAVKEQVGCTFESNSFVNFFCKSGGLTRHIRFHLPRILRAMKMDRELWSVVLAFGFGTLVGYWAAPNDWYRDRVQTCLDVGELSHEDCFHGVADWAYEAYLYTE